MKQLLFLLFFSISAISITIGTAARANDTQLIQYSGSAIEEPYWFKESFLDITDDINEAEEAGKHLLIYFHQAGCPYCYNLVQQSFLDSHLSEFIQKHFDVVALNLWGDREVTLPDGTLITEKQLAIKLNIQFTPTLLFYSNAQEAPLRINGYRSKEDLAKVFDYVLTGTTEDTLAQALIRNATTEVKSSMNTRLYPSKTFQTLKTLSLQRNYKPTAVLFEYPDCQDCQQLHKKVLSRKDTDQLLSEYLAVRANLSSNELIDIDEETSLTAKQWADDLGLTYFPSLVLYDENFEEKFRIDSYVQRFHFQSALEYVSGKIYLRLPEFQRYINERADRLRQAGKNIHITE